MHAYLLPCLQFGPRVVERIIARMPASDHDRVLEAGRFTPREVVAHLADWEPIMRDRVRQALDRPGSAIQAYDEGQMAIDHRYSETDLAEQMKVFRLERQKTSEYANSISSADLHKSVTHPERGVQTVEDLIGMLLGHDMYHVEQLSAYLGD